MRRLYFRLIVPDGPLRRFRLAEDFGEERRSGKRQSEEGFSPARVTGLAMAWCGLSAGCWLLAHGHAPSVSLEPLVALSSEEQPYAWAMATPRPNAALLSPPTGSSPRARVAEQNGVGTGAVSTTMPSAALPVPPNVALAPAIRRDLPRVSYSVSVLHAGGELAPRERTSSLPEPVREDAASQGVTSREPFSDGERTTAIRSPDTIRSLTERTRLSEPAVFAPPRGREPTAASDDPFEADFIAAQTQLPLPQRPALAQSKPELERVPELANRRPNGSTGRHVLHTGGGCQAAFDASNQVVNVSKGVAGTDATSEDYTQVLSRMNILTCQPPRPLSVQVCVAVSDRRAAGVTVTTTPGNAAVASCIARQISSMRFPASTGADLVRTRVDVD
jgi:hypothetical protein